MGSDSQEKGKSGREVKTPAKTCTCLHMIHQGIASTCDFALYEITFVLAYWPCSKPERNQWMALECTGGLASTLHCRETLDDSTMIKGLKRPNLMTGASAISTQHTPPILLTAYKPRTAWKTYGASRHRPWLHAVTRALRFTRGKMHSTQFRRFVY